MRKNWHLQIDTYALESLPLSFVCSHGKAGPDGELKTLELER
jgi:hypothetical protein